MVILDYGLFLKYMEIAHNVKEGCKGYFWCRLSSSKVCILCSLSTYYLFDKFLGSESV